MPAHDGDVLRTGRDYVRLDYARGSGKHVECHCYSQCANETPWEGGQRHATTALPSAVGLGKNGAARNPKSNFDTGTSGECENENGCEGVAHPVPEALALPVLEFDAAMFRPKIVR